MVTAPEFSFKYYEQLLSEASAGTGPLVRIWIRRKYRPRLDCIFPDRSSRLHGLVIDHKKNSEGVDVLCLFSRWPLTVVCRDKLERIAT